MNIRVMNFRKQTFGALAALLICGMSLAGCVVYPSGYGYGYGGGYYAPAVVAPPIYGNVIIGGGWGHGWGGGGWRR